MTISGQFTHFSTASVVTFSGTGITAGPPTVATPTSLTVPVSIAASAPLGAEGIQVVTGTEALSQANAFIVTAGTPVITLVSPNSGQQGQANLAVTITGQFTHFALSVTQVSFGSDITVNSVTVASTTSLTANITIPVAANLGPHTVSVTTGAEVALVSNGFTPLSENLTKWAYYAGLPILRTARSSRLLTASRLALSSR